MNSRQLLHFVVRPTLDHLQLGGPVAEALVLGTAAHESGGFRFIDQVTHANDVTLGPALGLFQMERPTHDDIRRRLNDAQSRFPRAYVIWKKLNEVTPFYPSLHEQLVGNLFYACAMCRIHYWLVPEDLPAQVDVSALARYWKRYYNTVAGKGHPSQFVTAFNRFVAPVIADVPKVTEV